MILSHVIVLALYDVGALVGAAMAHDEVCVRVCWAMIVVHRVAVRAKVRRRVYGHAGVVLACCLGTAAPALVSIASSCEAVNVGGTCFLSGPCHSFLLIGE